MRALCYNKIEDNFNTMGEDELDYYTDLILDQFNELTSQKWIDSTLDNMISTI